MLLTQVLLTTECFHPFLGCETCLTCLCNKFNPSSIAIGCQSVNSFFSPKYLKRKAKSLREDFPGVSEGCRLEDQWSENAHIHFSHSPRAFYHDYTFIFFIR